MSKYFKYALISCIIAVLFISCDQNTITNYDKVTGFYVMNDEWLYPSFSLKDDKSVVFSRGALYSSLSSGTYEIKSNTLEIKLKNSDEKYVFEIAKDRLIFDEKKSTPLNYVDFHEEEVEKSDVKSTSTAIKATEKNILKNAKDKTEFIKQSLPFPEAKDITRLDIQTPYLENIQELHLEDTKDIEYFMSALGKISYTKTVPEDHQHFESVQHSYSEDKGRKWIYNIDIFYKDEEGKEKKSNLKFISTSYAIFDNQYFSISNYGNEYDMEKLHKLFEKYKDLVKVKKYK